MTDQESQAIETLQRTIDDLRDEVRESLQWINGAGGVPGAKERIAALEREKAGRLSWLQCMLCGCLPAAVPVIYELMKSGGGR